MLRTRRTVLGYAAGLVAAAGTRPVGAAGPDLHVQGREVWLGGVPTTLRGVAVGDALLARAPRPPSDYGFLVSRWRASLVRINMHPGLWRAKGGLAAAALGREVAAARRHGLQVIIAWHAIGWPDGAFEHPDPEWQQPADIYETDLDLAHAFWTEMAGLFGGDPGVLFEIWNEPVRLAAPDGGSPWGVDWRDLRPVWIGLTETIRRRAGNAILATGGNWASDLTGIREAPLPDGNTAYAWHVYPGTARGDPLLLERRLDALPRVFPVFVTEWGFSPERDGHLGGRRDGFGEMFARRFLRAYDLHWTAWCWHPDWEPPLIEPDWRTPTPAGALAMALLAQPDG